MSKTRKTLLNILTDHPEGLTIEEMVEKSGYNKNTVWTAIRRMRDDGKVESKPNPMNLKSKLFEPTVKVTA